MGETLTGSVVVVAGEVTEVVAAGSVCLRVSVVQPKAARAKKKTSPRLAFKGDGVG